MENSEKKKKNLFSCPKWQPAVSAIIINDIHSKLLAGKSFVKRLQKKKWTNKKLYFKKSLS